MADQTATPSSRWKEAGQEDIHGDRFDCERAQLALGHLTDDEMAYAVYMHGNTKLTTAQLVAGELMPEVYLTGARDRIRWLSRALEEALAALLKLTTDRDERVKNNLSLRARNEMLEDLPNAANLLLKEVCNEVPHGWGASFAESDPYARISDFTDTAAKAE